MTIRLFAGLAVVVALTGCGAPMTGPQVPPVGVATPEPGTPEAALRTFGAVVDQVEPVAEQICRERTRGVKCRFRIAIDDRPGQAPNAFQTVDDAGNPVIVFNLALLADARTPDELAFVMGHEAAHHIAGHMARQQETALAGAVVAGTLATLGGGDAAAVKAAQDMGAEMGARTFSKDFELEADALGTEIAWRAGFDPLLGAQFFTRLPDPGNRFLGSHPPNAERIAIVTQTMATLR